MSGKRDNLIEFILCQAPIWTWSKVQTPLSLHDSSPNFGEERKVYLPKLEIAMR